jgi:primosomal protein N'
MDTMIECEWCNSKIKKNCKTCSKCGGPNYKKMGKDHIHTEMKYDPDIPNVSMIMIYLCVVVIPGILITTLLYLIWAM